MSIVALKCLILSYDWDYPIFKILAHNDTGDAKGHQGGIVIPKDLRKFFPCLLGNLSASSPTIDRRIKTELFVENRFLTTVSTRYQLQSWGGVRSPESRLTDELGPLRNLASGGDVLVIQRSIDGFDHYRLTLVRKSQADFGLLSKLIGGRRWGTLTSAPLSDEDLETAFEEEKNQEQLPFQLIDHTTETSTTVVQKVARSLAFRAKVISLYDETCALCGQALKSPAGLVEVDAAHVVPRSLFGADDARNGLALCKKHHWAFDKGLFGVSDKRIVFVPNSVQAVPQNKELNSFSGQAIREAKDSFLRVHPEAFRWHIDNVMLPS